MYSSLRMDIDTQLFLSIYILDMKVESIVENNLTRFIILKLVYILDPYKI